MIDASRIIDRLEQFGASLPAVVAGLPLADARWKPADGAWSVVEVLHHLLDEEVEDFRQRLKLTLESPQQDWPPIDPEGWAVQGRYNDADPEKIIAQFVAERRASVTWLREKAASAASDWSIAHVHPKYGAFRAGDLLAAWAAHDALHLRQIAKRLHQLAARDAGEFSIIYAGEWHG
jgi:hypothetical protein